MVRCGSGDVYKSDCTYSHTQELLHTTFKFAAHDTHVLFIHVGRPRSISIVCVKSDLAFGCFMFAVTFHGLQH